MGGESNQQVDVHTKGDAETSLVDDMPLLLWSTVCRDSVLVVSSTLMTLSVPVAALIVESKGLGPRSPPPDASRRARTPRAGP